MQVVDGRCRPFPTPWQGLSRAPPSLGLRPWTGGWHLSQRQEAPFRTRGTRGPQGQSRVDRGTSGRPSGRRVAGITTF